MSLRALVLSQGADRKVSGAIETLPVDRLPAGDVTVAVDYSTLNYKDGLVLTTGGGLVKTWPHVGGIDFSGTVEASDNPAFKPGDKVVLNGWRVGELHWGGYATKARVKGDWLVKLPAAISTRRAMAIGTAGYTSMLCVMALEKHGLKPAAGEILVTGAAGGVGSVAVAILAKLGFSVVAATGRPQEGDYLKALGAAAIMDRKELADAPDRPLLSERFAGVVDTVSGVMFAKSAGPGEVRRRRRGVRPRRRPRVPRLDPALHPARRQRLRHRFGDAAQGAARGGLAPPRQRPAARQARQHGERGGAVEPDDAGPKNPQRRNTRPRGGRCRQVIGSATAVMTASVYQRRRSPP